MSEPVPADRPKALPPGVFPPEVAGLDGIRLRRPVPEDAEDLHAAITASFAELHQWMPWCTDPVELDEQRAFIRRSTEEWAAQSTFNWVIVDARGELIGSIGLMDRIGNAGLEIGYWLRSDATGRGAITRAAAWATDVALSLPGIERVEIHCDSANVRSAAVPRRLGFRLDREEATEPKTPGESGLSQFWVTP